MENIVFQIEYFQRKMEQKYNVSCLSHQRMFVKLRLRMDHSLSIVNICSVFIRQTRLMSLVFIAEDKQY